ncbi:Wadjet anti-phage system protein JetD domain-containing protein [Rheinheimera gaetbuli]
MPNRTDINSWGLLPEDVIEVLKLKYWNNRKNLKSLLCGEMVFPLEISLKPPTGNSPLKDINHYQNFIAGWRSFCKEIELRGKSSYVRWESRKYRSLLEQEIPTHLIVNDIQSLAGLLGSSQELQLKKWHFTIAYIFEALVQDINKRSDTLERAIRERSLFLVLISHLEVLTDLNDADLELLVKLIPQLYKGMGRGCYLRALPVTFVDTKFVEKYLKIIESILTAVVDSSVHELGLLSWLDCKEKPKDWLLVKPLSKETMNLLGGIPLLRMSSETLLNFELPAENILVIENEQSCLSLDDIPKTIAVSGGGKNVAWLKAKWLDNKRVGYWGDIDSEGFGILGDVRSKLGDIVPLMMDSETVEKYKKRMVNESESLAKEPVALLEHELNLFRKLRSGEFGNTRLEQERLPMDYVYEKLKLWAG